MFFAPLWRQNIDFTADLLHKFLVDIEALAQSADPQNLPLAKLEAFLR